MIDSRPFATVLMPAIGSEAYLAECIDIALGRDCQDWEHGFFDDCSGDLCWVGGRLRGLSICA